jgi:hypothetical protein
MELLFALIVLCRTVLLNNTLYNTCKCSVLYNSYKCGTEVQTSSMGLHEAILHFMHSWTRINFGCLGEFLRHVERAGAACGAECT